MVISTNLNLKAVGMQAPALWPAAQPPKNVRVFHLYFMLQWTDLGHIN